MRRVYLYIFAVSLLTLVAGFSSDKSFAQGRAITHVFTPSGKGPFPAVIVLHTIAGVRPPIVSYAKGLSKKGYIAIVVNFLTKGGTDNIEDGYDYLKRHAKVLPERIGVVGFSKGSFEGINFAYYSHNFTERRVAAVVSFYIGPYTPGNDEKLPPVLFLHGDRDVHVSADAVRKFCKFQNESGAICEAQIYKGGKHAFDQKTRYRGYSKRIKTDSYRRAIQFLDKYLKPKAR